MVDYSNAKINMHVAVAEKLFRIRKCNVKVKMCGFCRGGGIFLTFFDQEYIVCHDNEYK